MAGKKPRIDRNEIKRRLTWRLLGSPLTLIPVLGGTTLLLTPLFFPVAALIPAALGVLGLGAGAAGFGMRWVQLKDKIGREVMEEMESEAEAAREKDFNLLLGRLAGDGDPRTEGLLKDVTKLADSIRADATWRDKVNVVAATDILAGIDELFEGCSSNLERSLELHEMVSTLSSKKGAQPLVDQREALIDEVEHSVGALTQLMADLRVLGTEAAGVKHDLGKVQSNLKTSLAAARKTEQEARSWKN